MAGRLGVYRDPWFGDVSICEAGEGVRFASAKSPMMTGDVMRVGDRLLWQWHRPDIEPCLHFGPEGSQPMTLTISTSEERSHMTEFVSSLIYSCCPYIKN